MKRLAIDRLVPIVLAIFLLAQWAGADYFVKTAGFITVSPFSPLWDAYSWDAAARLVVPILVGIGFSLMVPVGPSMTVGEIVTRTQALTAKLAGVWLATAVAALALMVFVKGPYLLYAPEYLMTQGPKALASLSTVMGPLGALASGALSKRRPGLGGLLALGISVVLFAGATRVFSAVPLLFFVGRYISGVKDAAVTWLATVVFALVTLPIPLICRSQQAHGLIPYSAAVAQAITQPDYVQNIGRTFGENVGMTVPLMIYVSRLNTFSLQDMMISINPLPAHAAGWDQIIGRMRVHDFIPFSALGEWARFGPLYLFGFVFVWAVIVRLCIASLSRNSSFLMLPMLVLAIALSSLIVLQLGQYNTRAIARLTDLLILMTLADLATRPIQPGRGVTVRGLANYAKPSREDLHP